MEEAVLKLKLEHPEWGRRKIANELGIGEKRVRTILSKHKGEIGEAGIKSVKYSNGETVIQAVIHLNDLNDQNAIMRACNYDPNAWECISSEVKAYQSLIKDSESKPVVTDLYSVTVKVKPKKNVLDLDWQSERIAQFKPVEIIRTKNNGQGLIDVFLTDMHFGINTFEDYEKTLQKVLNLLPGYDTLALALGSDNIHVNGHKNMTVNGTQLEEVDINKAFDDAVNFFANIITHALNQGMAVNTFYIPANHDYDLSWTVCKTLERMFPDVKIDTVMYQYKAMRYGDVALGWTHGDEGRNFDRVFMREFPEIFGTAEVLEVHSGHVHKETVQDQSGVLVRTLPTKTKRTNWTKKKGLHSVRRFQVFGYTKDELKNIYYV